MIKKVLIAAVVVVALGWNASALALTHLKQVQVSPNDQINLLFDQTLKPHQIETEFFRDIVQISVKNAAVYPAKILTVKGDVVSKVFAYQYTPKRIRTRFTVDGDAQNYKDKVEIVHKGKIITVRFKSIANNRQPAIVEDKIEIPKAQAIRPEEPSASEPKTYSAMEKEILDKVQSAEPVQEASEPKSIPAQAKVVKKSKAAQSWTGLAMKSVFAIFAVFGIFVLFWFMKRSGRGLPVLGKSSGKIAGKLWPFKKMDIPGLFKKAMPMSGRMIQVEGSHYLGPNKSLAVIKVKDRELLIGITDKSISLITELSGDSSSPMDDSDSADRVGFQDLFKKEVQKPGGEADAFQAAHNPTPHHVSEDLGQIRERIRQRVEGMKTL